MDKIDLIRKHFLEGDFPKELMLPESTHQLNNPNGGMPRFRCGFPVNTKAYRWANNCISDYALVYVLCGHGHYSDENGRHYELAPGSLLRRLPGLIHDEVFESERIVRCYVGMPRQILELLEMTSPWKKLPIVTNLGYQEELILKINNLLKRTDSCPRNELSHLANDYFRFATFIHDLLTKEMVPVQTQSRELLEKACFLLASDLDQRISLQTVAQRLNLGYASFRNFFKKATGVAPGEYRIQRRIEFAKVLLGQDNLSLQEIANKLNYSDVYAFAKQFKSFTNISPGQFRKRHPF